MNFLFVALYLLFPIFIIVVMEKAGIGILEVSIPSFVILSMFTFAYIGTLPLYFGWDQYRYSIGIQDRSLIFTMFVYSSWSIFAMVLGFIFSKYIIGLKSPTKEKVLYRPLKKSELYFVFVLLLCCFGILWIYLLKVPTVALFVALEEGAKKGYVARSLMNTGFSGKFYRYSFFFNELLSLITFIIFGNFLIKKRWASFSLCLVAFGGASFAAVMRLHKAPFCWLLIGLFLVYVFIKHDRKIPMSSFFKVGPLLIVPLIVFYIYLAGPNGPIEAGKAIVSRVFSGSIQTAYYYLEFFPEHENFLMGGFFPNPGGILPFEPYPLTTVLHDWFFPENVAKGITGSCPAVFWAGMYANFGLVGVLIPPFFIGLFLYVVNFLLFKLPNTSFKIGLIVWSAIHYRILAVSDIGRYIYDINMLGTVVIVIIIIMLSNKGKLITSQ